MEKTIFISLPIEDLQAVIIDCVNACLKNHKPAFQSPSPNDKLLNVEEAAQFLHLSVPTIYGLVGKSQLPVNKRGKRLYFSEKELLNWVKEGRKKTISETENEAENYLNRKAR
jgi:excisionase family DNA binding protein